MCAYCFVDAEKLETPLSTNEFARTRPQEGDGEEATESMQCAVVMIETELNDERTNE